jgi:hypothetical protein
MAEAITPWKQAPINTLKPEPMQIDSSNLRSYRKRRKTNDAKKTYIYIEE